jgi:GNAT superfamily N-acetyltransferase
MSAITYTPATLEDLSAVVDLCMTVEEQHEQYWPLRWQRRPGLREGYLGWLSKRLDEPRMRILVAKDAALVVGTLLATIEKEIPIYTYTEYAFVQDMAVLPSHQRRGIAQRLLHDAAAWARTHHLTQLRLMVAHHNPTARAAFEKAGFLPTYQEMLLPLQPP